MHTLMQMLGENLAATKCQPLWFGVDLKVSHWYMYQSLYGKKTCVNKPCAARRKGPSSGQLFWAC